jgi:methionyl-tRNA formyltransferase
MMADPNTATGLAVVVMGTGPFILPSFAALLASRHRLVAVVTRPDRSARGRRPPPNPMRQAAEAAGLTVLAPPDVNAEEVRQQLAALQPDLLVVCDYGQILSAATLGVAALGGINLHGSLPATSSPADRQQSARGKQQPNSNHGWLNWASRRCLRPSTS